MVKTWCVGRRQYSDTINRTEFGKLNPKTEKLVENIERNCSICGPNKSQFFTR